MRLILEYLGVTLQYLAVRKSLTQPSACQQAGWSPEKEEETISLGLYSKNERHAYRTLCKGLPFVVPALELRTVLCSFSPIFFLPFLSKQSRPLLVAGAANQFICIQTERTDRCSESSVGFYFHIS